MGEKVKIGVAVMMRFKNNFFVMLTVAVLCSIFALSSCGEGESAEYTLRIDGYMLCGFETVGDGMIDLVVPEGVTAIVDGAFKNNKRIRSVTLPEGIETIGWNAFSGCNSLKSLNIPESVTSIGNTSFAGCKSILESDGGVYYVDRWAVDCKKSLFGIELRAGTVGIADHAFSGRERLLSAILPEGLLYIGDMAFTSCSISEMVVPDSVRSIGYSAFSQTKLIRCQLPEGLTRIPDTCFRKCSRLTTVNIPESVTSIGINAFEETDVLKIVGCTYYVGNWAVGLAADKESRVPQLAEGTVGIADGAFMMATKYLPVLCEGIKYLGKECFSYHGTSKITIPVSVVNLSGEAFPESVTKLYIAEGRETVDVGLFKSIWVGGMYVCVGTELQNASASTGVYALYLERRAGYEWVAVINGEETVLGGDGAEKWITVEKPWKNIGLERIFSRVAEDERL